MSPKPCFFLNLLNKVKFLLEFLIYTFNTYLLLTTVNIITNIALLQIIKC